MSHGGNWRKWGSILTNPLGAIRTRWRYLTSRLAQIELIVGQVAAIQAQVQSLGTMVGTIHAELKPLKGEVAMIYEEIESLKGQVALIQSHVAPLGEVVALIQSQLEPLNGEVTTIHAELKPLKGEVAMIYGEIESLKGEVALIQSHVAPLGEVVASIQSQLEPLKGEVTTIHAELKPLKGEVAMIHGEIEPLKSQVASIQYQVVPLGDVVASIQSQLEPLKGQVASIQSHVAPLGDVVASIQSQLEPLNEHVAPIQSLVAPLGEQLAAIKSQFDLIEGQFNGLRADVQSTYFHNWSADKRILSPVYGGDSVRVLEAMRLLAPFDVRDRRFRRAGREFDGGYVMVDDLSMAKVAVSCGIETEVSWDLEMASLGLEVIQFDHTIERSPEEHPRFRFNRLAIRATEGEDGVTLRQIVSNLGEKAKGGILKLDIERSEWPVLAAVDSDTLASFSQILIEFHELHYMPLFMEQVEAGFATLLKHFFPTHVHANNHEEVYSVGGIMVPRVLEVTFANRKWFEPAPLTRTFPTPLDRRNDPRRPEIHLGRFAF